MPRNPCPQGKDGKGAAPSNGAPGSALAGGVAPRRGRARFFQLSADLTTIRWSWNRYVLVHDVNSIVSDRWGA